MLLRASSWPVPALGEDAESFTEPHAAPDTKFYLSQLIKFIAMRSRTPSPAPSSPANSLTEALSGLSELDCRVFNDIVLTDDEEPAFSSSSSSSSYSPLTRPAKRRKVRAANTWCICRDLRAGEPEFHTDGKRVLYCSRCLWNGYVTTNIRGHLKKFMI
ncbi:hypothetical protein GQ43DRAFT_296948 [Delitschia confertaspora ATCC 74209]|uniref:Uncharacterized protein n=1 Tax=Delitschia confertaspora ATCC 74209 TaxID=1513339 RepID=A0A9P4JR25_9PLEO|nr:hypothetical protein GQ43DRAFT_296948 [Delitschia confertaspora ATCC 74209]